MVAIFTGTGTGFERGSGSVLGSAGLLGGSNLGRGGEQLFFNAASGNLMVTHRDEFLVGRGPDVGISRTYNSQGNFTDENGDNWRQSTDRKIFGFVGTVNAFGSSVKRRSADGSEITYSWNGSLYAATEGGGAYDTLSYNGGSNSWTWVDGDSRVTEMYNAYGSDWRIVSQTDTSGNTVSYSYSGDKLWRTSTADGSYVEYGWSGNTIVSLVTGYTDLSNNSARALTRARYGYDGYNRLATVTVDLSPEDNSTGDGNVYTTTYSYHGASKLIQGISQSDGSSVTIGYDGWNRVNSWTETVASGVTRTTTIGYGDGFTNITDPAGQTIRLDYQRANTGGAPDQLTRITAPPAFAGAAQQVVQFGYDAYGNLASVTDAAGQTATYSYDGNGNVVVATDRTGQQTVRTYNAANQILTESRVGSNKDTSAAWHTGRYVYDGANRLRYTVSADGRVTEYRYDGYGQRYFTLEFTNQFYDVSALPTSATLTEAQLDSWRNSLSDATQVNHLQHGYDARGNLTTTIRYGGSYAPGWADTANGYTHEYFTYDQAGQLRSNVVAGQNSRSYVYDGLGRVTASTDVSGGTTSFVFNDAATQTTVTLANGFVQVSAYNKAGELVAFTESGDATVGGTTTYKYDQLGRLRQQTDANGINRYFLYDKVGRKVAEVNHYGWVTEYRYDQNDRLVATVNYTNGLNSGQLASLADPNAQIEMAAIRPGYHPYDVWTWKVYDQEGRVSEAISGDGSVTVYDYDASGRLIKTTGYANKLAGWQIDGFKNAAPTTRVVPGASGNDAIARVFYDKDGNVIGALDGEGYLSRIIYDAGGRKIQEIAYANATNPGYRGSGTFQDLINSVGVSGGDRSTRYVYDQQDHLRFVIDALGRVTEYGYQYDWTWSAFGPVRSTTQYAGTIGALSSYTYASVKSAVAGQAGAAANRVSYAIYDDAGRLAYAIDAGGAVTGYTYNVLNQVTKVVQYAATYGVGYLPSRGEMDSFAANNGGNGANRVTRNYYAARGELRFTIDAEGYVTRFDYDAEGRETFRAKWNNAVNANDGWNLWTVNGTVGGDWAGDWTYYDADGRITAKSNSEGLTQHYFYWANGTLCWKIDQYGSGDESRSLYYYDAAGRVTLQYDAYGTSEQRSTQYAYDGLGNLTAVTDGNNRTTYRGYDKLGRVVSETDAIGGTRSYQYDALGNLVRATDERGNATYSYYDQIGRVVASRDAEDYVTETSYTVFGEVNTVTRRYNRAWNGAGVGVWPAVSGDGRDATTSFGYDKLGRVTRTTDAEGYSEYRWYDAFGNVSQIQNKIGGFTNYTYDRRNQLRYEWVQANVYDNNGTVTASGYHKNIFEYDARGNMVHQIEGHNLPERRDTWFTYDKANRLISKQGSGVTVVSASDHAGIWSAQPTTTYRYDARDNLIEVVDPNGQRTLFYYDKQDRKIAEVNAVGTLTTYAYDAVGNMTAQRTWGTAIGLPGSAGGNPPGAPGGEYRETTYAYDNLNRLVSSSIANVRTGWWNGSSFSLGYGTVTTSYQYDAAGNIVRTTDGNGASVFSYYDRDGRKIAQVDQEGYVTRWTLDAEGNVTQERRYATQTGGASVGGQPWVPDSGADRITNFTYDRNGRRTSEQRLNVIAYGVSGGALYGVSSTSAIAYAYNGLGQVTVKTEAAGDQVLYEYDSSGRLTSEMRAGFYDVDGAWTRPLVIYQYDALGNLARTVQTAQYGGASRVTRYVYTGGGRLEFMIDPNGQTTSYYYDTAGNLLRQSYSRERSDGGSVYDGILYTRDAVGRVTSQTTASWNGSWWVKGDIQDIAYNAYGDVSQRGLNGGWQEQFAYDGMGQLYRTNQGDGVWRYFVHDGAGNQTAVIESEGSSIAWMSLESALATATANWGYSLGGVYLDGINVTLTGYDRRGQATQAIQTQRQLSESGGVTNLTTTRSYTAFGEVASEVDARGSTTTYTYNTMGRLTAVQRPWVIVTNAGGGSYWTQPTELLYYDASGRLIGQDDANGNRTTRALLAGTGYGGSEAQVTAEWHADGGVLQTFYDRYGDQRRQISETGRNSWMYYDGMGRLTQVTRNSGNADYYAYDLLGQRIRHWTSAYGGGVVERTDYDSQGRVTTQIGFGGDVTTTSYSWNGGIGTWGMGTFGGWVETTSYANGRSSTEYSDMFGRVTYTTDLGGHVTYFSFDLGGRQVQRWGSGAAVTTNWLNSGLVGSIVSGYGNAATAPNNVGESYQTDRTSFSYDANGNRLSEVYTRQNGQWADNGYWEYWDYWGGGGYWVSNWQWQEWSSTYRNATASYDAMNRMTGWNDSGNPTAPAAWVNWSYDAVGNVRRVNAGFAMLDQNGAAAYNSGQDYWYTYDAMNRIAVAKGQLINGQIQRGTSGTSFSYFTDGRRATATTSFTGNAQVWDPYYYDPYGYGYGWEYGWGGGYGGYVSVSYTGDRRESYGYDADGALSSVSMAESGWYDNGDGTVTVTAPAGAGALKAQYWYDGLGRMTRQLDYLYDGNYNGTAAYDRQITLDVAGRSTSETVSSRQGNDTITSYVYNDYGYGGSYALGAVVSSTSYAYKNGGYQYTATTTNTYAWYAGAVQASVSYAQSGQSTKTSTYAYDGWGTLQSVYVGDGRPRSVSFTNDMFGQVIRRDESDNVWNQGDPHEVWYRFGGKQIGYTGNNGTADVDYQASIASRTATSGNGAFRGGSTWGGAYADFDQSGVDPINSFSQGSSGGSYTVRQGDTLASIAQTLLGDANLWYKLAEANGLSGGSALTEGQRLTLPAGVQRASFNASTLNPYDAAEILGDTNPTTPTPQAPKKNKCGVFGLILLAVVAIAVVAVSHGTLSGFFAHAFGATAASTAGSAAVVAGNIVGGAVAGALGSVVSQGVGLALGIQDKFSWKGVALAALGGAVGGALGPGGAFGANGAFSKLGNVVGGALRGAVSSAATQGIGVATGLQSKFDFVGVAAAGVGGGVGGAVGGAIGNKLGEFGGQLVTNAASGLANAATRSVLEGSSFGDNIIAALPDIIGQTVGGLVAGAIEGDPDSPRKAARRVDEQFESFLSDEERRSPEFKAGRKVARAEFEADIATARAANDPVLLRLARDRYADFYASRSPAFASELSQARSLSAAPDLSQTRSLGAAPDLSRDAQFLGLTLDTVVVTGSRLPRGVAILPFVDPLSVEAGNIAFNIGSTASAAIDRVPGGRLAVTLLDVGLTIAGGTTRYAVGKVYEAGKDSLIAYATRRFVAAGYGRDAAAGGVGLPVLGSLLTGGVSAGLKTLSVLGGIAIRNGHLAGGKHPVTDVPFDSDGFPDFSAYATHTVQINQTGRRRTDDRAANAAAGLGKTPKGYTWHHHQDGTTMQLVPTPVHRATGHTGGVAVKKRP